MQHYHIPNKSTQNHSHGSVSSQTEQEKAATVQCKTTSSPLINITFTFLISILLHLAGDIHPHPGPPDLTLNGFSVCHINAHSIRNKIPSIHCELNCFDVITVSETWLSDDISNEQLLIPGFQPPIRCDRSHQAYGGVAVYVKNNLVCKFRPDLTVPGLEAVWVETRLGQEPLLIGTLYRPPGAPVAYWNLIDQSIQLAGNTTSKYILLGDLNADCTHQPPQHLQNIMTINNLYQIINKPTHITDTSSTTIDIILTPCPDLVQATDVLPPVCSDHCVPYTVLKNKHITNKRYSRTFYNYKKLNVGKLIESLSSTDWDSIINLESIDDAAKGVSDRIMNVAKTCMPVREVLVNDQDAPWINKEIKTLIKRKNHIHRLAKASNTTRAWALFRRTRNDLTNIIRRRKAEYISELDKKISSSNEFGTKDWWKLVKEYMSKKGLPQDDIPPIEDENNTVHYTARDKAEVFNQYFAAQCSTENPNEDFPRGNEFQGSIDDLIITQDAVLSTLKHLDNKKAVGPDLVHNKILTAASEAICAPLTGLFNRSLREAKFPSVWKTAHVTPIYKKGDKQSCGNYRPISLLSCIGKVLEKCVQQHVLTYLVDNNLLTDAQSGFIPKDSTVFQLTCIYDDFCKFLDTKTTAQAVFFDISKAFDKVWHRALLYKMSALGIQGRLLDWFKDYLTNRKQAVVIKGSTSTYRPVSAGVPQGSVLGPVLFLIYINDIVRDIQSSVKLFADDTSMYLGLENTNERTNILNSDLDKINKWAKTWKVKFNQTKTKLMTISNIREPNTQPLIFGNDILDEIDSHKHLGVIIQKDCKWDLHIKSILSKCRILIGCLRSFKYRLSRRSLQTMYKSFIMPHFDFSDVIWDNCTNEQADALETLHLDALRTIIGTVRGTSHHKLYKESGFTSLKERRKRHKIILYSKIVHGSVPTYMSNRLPNLVADINPYHRRRPLERQIPRCRLQIYKSSFFPSTTALWNELPDNVKQSNSIGFLKHFLSSDDSFVPEHFFLPDTDRHLETILCKLRLEMSDLNNDLFHRHLRNNPTCNCGSAVEDTYHFLLVCPLYQQARNLTISLLPNEIKNNVTTLLSGSPHRNIQANREILATVCNFISLSNRFPSV